MISLLLAQISTLVGIKSPSIHTMNHHVCRGLGSIFEDIGLSLAFNRLKSQREMACKIFVGNQIFTLVVVDVYGNEGGRIAWYCERGRSKSWALETYSRFGCRCLLAFGGV
jgi:hypothetical protein